MHARLCLAENMQMPCQPANTSVMRIAGQGCLERENIRLPVPPRKPGATYLAVAALGHDHSDLLAAVADIADLRRHSLRLHKSSVDHTSCTHR